MEELQLEDLVTNQVQERPWQNAAYHKSNATWQSAALRRHMHRRRSNAALGVASVDLSGPHEPTPMVNAKIGQRPAHYFVALTLDPSTASADMGCQTEAPDEAAGTPVVTPEGEAQHEERQTRPPLVYAALIAQKSEAAAAVMQMLATARDDHGRLPHELVFRLHSDEGQEFLPESLEAYCRLHAIARTTTAGYDPSANGGAENAIGFLKRKSRQLLTGARMPSCWWGSAVLASAYYSRCAVGLRKWPSLPFGTRCMVVRDPAPRNAFVPQAMPATVMGGGLGARAEWGHRVPGRNPARTSRCSNHGPRTRGADVGQGPFAGF